MATKRCGWRHLHTRVATIRYGGATKKVDFALTLHTSVGLCHKIWLAPPRSTQTLLAKLTFAVSPLGSAIFTELRVCHLPGSVVVLSVFLQTQNYSYMVLF